MSLEMDLLRMMEITKSNSKDLSMPSRLLPSSESKQNPNDMAIL